MSEGFSIRDERPGPASQCVVLTSARETVASKLALLTQNIHLWTDFHEKTWFTDTPKNYKKFKEISKIPKFH